MPAPRTPVVNQFQQDGTAQLNPPIILTVCQDIGSEWRERCLDPVTPFPLFFVQVAPGKTACTHRRHLPTLDVTASAYCQARTRLPLEVFTRLLWAVGDAVHHQPLDEGRWVGQRTCWAAGSSWSMPDTPELPEHVGQPGGQQPGWGFPVAPLRVLLQAGTGMALRLLRAPLRTHDLSQAGQLHPALHAGDVLVADRGLGSYAPLARLVPGGGHAVVRMHQQQLVDCTPGRPHREPRQRSPKGPTGLPRSRGVRQLGQQDHVVDWLKPVPCPEWMSPEP